jgi:hypothetical protein
MKNDDRWYCVVSDDVKTHFCSNYYLAQAVANDLKERDLDKNLKIRITPEDITGNKRYEIFHAAEEIGHIKKSATIALPDNVKIQISDEPSAKNRLKDLIASMQCDKYGGSFYKLHDESHTILCLTTEQGLTLKESCA